jgi:alkylhydroperoxidase/carboxymuconolactone decarboxylase family protein YurZ
MTKQVELFGVQYKEGSLEPKTAEFIKFAVNLAIGHEHGAKLHLDRARKCGASPQISAVE